jgi:glyoxylase-like metal-dependent hydrolase (beta-lactamase superfamily II)
VSERLYFRQLLAGRDFAIGDPFARQMVNFVYAVGDRETGDAVLIDPAYRPLELLEIVRRDGLDVTGVIATHYHADHVGGSLFDNEIDGIKELLEVTDVPVHLQRPESEWVTSTTHVDASALVEHDSGDVIKVGDIALTLIHTPGHTPGSQCVLVDDKLVSGDTLFLDGCGRTDLPGSDPEEMYRTLSERLAPISDSTVLFPGHFYSPEPSASMSDVRKFNFVLAPQSREQWMAMFA